MKKILTALALTATLIVTGCGIKAPPTKEPATQFEIDLADIENSMVSQCQADKAKVEANEHERIMSLDEGHRLVAIVSNQWKQAMMGFEAQDSCRPGSEDWKAWVSYYETMGEIYTVAITEGGKTVRFAAGVGGAVLVTDKLVGAMGDRISGDKSTAGHNITNAQDKAKVDVSSNEEFAEDHDTNVSSQTGTYESTQNVDKTTGDIQEEVTEEEVPDLGGVESTSTP